MELIKGERKPEQIFGGTKCDECGKERIDLVRLGEDDLYYECTTEVCKECLQKALKLISAGKPESEPQSSQHHRSTELLSAADQDAQG
ncbi:hypothetical protein HBA55_29795 [Pseudomaricurvus alkylphenolicus]|uniref:hypothetical protein n=1 Tax=Pseudomaricurvus alkylphenolicus TaxID=1306991 RepID=UPI0014228AB1|nr:hypothetical protein [Pseudomaricurvus alkylphenolicus]NIB43833.1 hypothetical protein [Pseudomaricurvus alkylphenolicus]